MFPKGPRFEPVKVPDVPPPGAYNIPDSEPESYKRGAFLDKAERFTKETANQVPGPGTYDQDAKKKLSKNVIRQQQTLSDRYAVLQRKVDDLERIHIEDKKSYQAEIDRLKSELARAQKTNAEQADRLDKQRKSTDLLEGRIQDLKKEVASGQGDVKELRSKLRMVEHERNLATAKQGEVDNLKKSLQSLEIRRKEEIQERDARIFNLEEALATQREKIRDVEQKGGTAAQKLQDKVDELRVNAIQAEDTLASFQKATAEKDASLLAQLECHRDLLRRVAEEYGRLASITVSAASHKVLQHRYTVSQMHISRLERKLANSEGQVIELAHLIRQVKESNEELDKMVKEMELEIGSYRTALQDLSSTALNRDVVGETLTDLLQAVQLDFLAARQERCAIHERTLGLTSDFYQLMCSGLLFEYSISEQLLREEQSLSQERATSLANTLASHKTIAAHLEVLQRDHTAMETRVQEATEREQEATSEKDTVLRRLAEANEKVSEAATVSEAAVKREKESIQKMSGVVQRSRIAEDALRREIEQLTTELAEAVKYQEAYYSLSDEIGSLLARNQLAEEEAKRLSRFNAEILSHNNPAQRIMYVDRIRKELAETKHQVIMLTREHEALAAVNEELQHELDMYSSVVVPVDHKPRTHLIRVARPPLVSLARSVNVQVSSVLESSKS